MTHDAADVPSGADLPDPLVEYLQGQARQRRTAVQRVLDGLEPRETRLVQEAAAMGYVQGTYAHYDDRVPPVSEVVHIVVDACLSFDDLYPTFAQLGARVPPQHPHEVAARVALDSHAPCCSGCHEGTGSCVCADGPVWVCTTCVNGAITDAARAPLAWPCPTLAVHGRWALCNADLEQPDGDCLRCTGALAFREGDLQARCLTCGAWCGRDVASYVP